MGIHWNDGKMTMMGNYWETLGPLDQIFLSDFQSWFLGVQSHRIHVQYAIYGVPWIPSIYPSHVSIYTSTMDPSWEWFPMDLVVESSGESSHQEVTRIHQGLTDFFVGKSPMSKPAHVWFVPTMKMVMTGGWFMIVLITLNTIKMATWGQITGRWFNINLENPQCQEERNLPTPQVTWRERVPHIFVGGKSVFGHFDHWFYISQHLFHHVFLPGLLKL